ncbi:capsular exopolysaccharide family [Serratia sp. AS12]|uniref:tyrosine-protein kinase Wzc n=1 Tax=Serratia TaxID=613 RepID=UPI00020E98A1|nr:MULTISPECIES: tyrosine-protein kinase Wzc [Serratia]AEF44693.1 capsular exopolysaccharide family [Serratia plymuthica AS9]AEF49645.1 capsular exopolysaccharide family [Serratia sp. AS12]AEG27352.1 capsular exopolysaccharide family [Serratia sp. AS13]UTN98194.1 tyrosine-protein kinase Wzc [Serratia plymuthica]
MIENKRAGATGSSHDDIDLGRLFGILIDHRWLIIGITLLFSVASMIYVMFATPIYQSDALIQVENKTGNAILSDLSQMISSSDASSSSTEIELIQSRMVVGKTVDDLGLDTIIAVKRFPIFGNGWAKLTSSETPKIALSRLSVRDSIIGSEMELKVVDKENYILSSDGVEILKGKIGQLASSDYVTMLATDIDAEPGTVFLVTKLYQINAINNVLKNLTVVDKGKDTGVLNLSYLNANPVLAKKILQSISNNYLLQNVERKSEEAAKSLAFLKEQLPIVQESLDTAENKLNLFRQQNSSVDLSLEAKSMLDTIVSTESQLNELTFKEAEISKLYTKEHPAYRALLEKRKTLEDERGNLNKKINSMPKTQQEIIRLTRDVDAGKEIYMQLLNKQQELSITKASTVGNVRVVDPAITQIKPVQPRTLLIIIIATILGMLISVTIVLLKTMLHKGIESPEQLEQEGVNVYASIPFSEWQQKKDKETFANYKKRHQPGKGNLLSTENPADLAIEAIRSLRTSLHFAMMEAKNNVLMISGASPNIGKTFVSINLAAVISQTGQKVLVIDADMRKGYSHSLLGFEGNNGLSDILSGKIEIEKAIKKTEISGMDFISRGQVPPNPAELLMTSRFETLISWATENYDLVLIDTPPILAVTDAAIIGHHVGTSLMVARFAMNTVKEIEVSMRRFEQNGIEIKGVILNAVERRAANYYDYYQYEYKS